MLFFSSLVTLPVYFLFTSKQLQSLICSPPFPCLFMTLAGAERGSGFWCPTIKPVSRCSISIVTWLWPCLEVPVQLKGHSVTWFVQSPLAAPDKHTVNIGSTEPRRYYLLLEIYTASLQYPPSTDFQWKILIGAVTAGCGCGRDSFILTTFHAWFRLTWFWNVPVGWTQ